MLIKAMRVFNSIVQNVDKVHFAKFFRLIESACLSRREALRGAELLGLSNEHPNKASNEESERLSTA